MQAHYRHTTPFYDVVVLTSPARIESIAVDPNGTGRHTGVLNNFGRLGSTVFVSYGSFSDVEANAVVAGRPAEVEASAEELRLVRVPVGERGIYATWSFIFGEQTFDIAIDWFVDRPQKDIWELGWKLDAAARHASTLAESRAIAWWEDDPRYAHTLITAFAPGSADRLDSTHVETPADRPTTSGWWRTVACDGGTTMPAGTLHGGRWRVGASGMAKDVEYARALADEVGGGAAAIAPEPLTRRESAREAAGDFAVKLGRPTFAADQVRRGPDGSWLLSDGSVLVAFVPAQRQWTCWLYARSGDKWRLTAASAPHVRFTSVVPNELGGLSVKGELRGLDNRLETTTDQVWTIRDDNESVPHAHRTHAVVSGAVHIHATDTPVAGHSTHPMHGFLAYPDALTKHDIDRYDVLSSPGLRPQADLVIGQRALWSPSVHVQHGSSSVALIPDLIEHLQEGNFAEMPEPHYFGPALDLDIADHRLDAPLLAFGWRAVEGVFGYYFRDRASTPSHHTTLSYDIVVRSGAQPRSVTSDVQRRLWHRVGSRYAAASTQPQTQPADAAFAEAWSYWQSHYDHIDIDGTTVGAVRCDRVLEPGINFMSWFNALRTAYGLFSYGRGRREWGGGRAELDDDLPARARSTLNLLLSAPQDQGAFPTIADIRGGGNGEMDGEKSARWQASHRNFLNQMPWGPDSYHTFDMGWAAYWLLRWHQDLEPEPRAVEFTTAYGDFVRRIQLPSGAVPSWIRASTFETDPHLRESAQTASSVLLLAELARVTGRNVYLDAAERAARYVVHSHLDRQRWDDFEPYYSNTLKSEGAADPFSGQHTQNTLSMHFAALGLLTIYELTGERSWLDDGARAVDAFLQYQYVTPGVGLSMNCFGGFAVQNTDNEALDARQSQFAVTLLDYARATGQAEYAERGIAALRAGFATMASPSAEVINPKYFDAYPVGRGPENYAHATFDCPAEYTNFDWGQGSAYAGFAEARNRFGDVWVDVQHGWAYGIDFVTVEHFHFDGDELALTLSSPAPDHTVLLKVSGVSSSRVRVRVNDQPERTYDSGELQRGITVPTRKLNHAW